MAYVTNAKGEVIYTGRTLRGTQSGVKDVQNTPLWWGKITIT